jgi:dipeptidyl aminopeptidase/acylaminoacyl peptidase
MTRIVRCAGAMALVMVVAGAVGLCQTPAQAQPSGQGAAASTVTGPSIQSFLRIRTPGAVRLNNDGSTYMVDWPDGINQIYKRAPGASTTDQGKKITSYADGVSGYSLSPDGKWAVVLHAVGGNEYTQVDLLDTSTDTIKPILSGAKIQHAVQEWLSDSSGFIYTKNDPSPRDFFVYRYDIGTGQSTLLSDKPGSWAVADVTDDGSRMLLSNYRSISDASVFELDTKTKTLTELSVKGPDGGTASQSFVGYLPGEKTALMVADIDGGMEQLFVRDLSNPASEPVLALPQLKGNELDGAEIDHTRSLVTTVHNEDGYAKMRLWRLPSFETVALPEIEPGLVGAGEIRGGTLVYSVTNSRSPSIAYAYDVPAAGEAAKAPRQLTARMDNEAVDTTKFRLPELVKYTSFDGLQIPAFVYLPEGAQKGKPIPFVANYHGGPEGQFRPGFDRTTQYLVSQGYGVIQPNVRGSTGYGRAFHMLDDYKKRWDSVKDGVEAVKWLISEGYTEKGRVATYGGSYGGFMAVACVIEGGEIFGAGCTVVGIVNVKTFLEQTAGYRQKLREVEYGPLSDPEFLKSISSIHRVDEIKVPMMIAHGLNDPRVPVGEAMQLAVALQARGHDPELLFFPDEGHGFAKLPNRVVFNERLVRFLDRTIGHGMTKP